MMEAIRSSEASVLTRFTRRQIAVWLFVRKLPTPSERPLQVGEVSGNFYG
jgi:hypothetical protein